MIDINCLFLLPDALYVKKVTNISVSGVSGKKHRGKSRVLPGGLS